MKQVGVIVVLVIALAVYPSNADEEAGKFIVGGERATQGQFPYRVSLRNMAFDDFHGCGASILNQNWLITAAHCFGGFPKDRLIDINAVVGSINPRMSGTRYNITQFILHPLWIRTFNPNDVGLIRTDRPIVFSELVQPIRISRRTVMPGDVVVAAGWGGTEQGFLPEIRMSEYLNVIRLNVISNRECRQMLFRFFGYNIWIRDNIFCTFNGFGSGVCSGDSGSAITLDGELVGVASMAIPCANGFPDWYPRLSDYADWIDNIISQ